MGNSHLQMVLQDVLHKAFNRGADGGARQTLQSEFGVIYHHELALLVGAGEHVLLRDEGLGVGGPEVLLEVEPAVLAPAAFLPDGHCGF